MRRGATLQFLVFAALCLPVIVMSYDSDVRLVDWPLEVSGYPALRDFSNLWSGGIAALAGTFDRLFYAPAHGEELARLLGIPAPPLVWSYPPTALLPALPFALLPYGAATALWSALGLAGYLSVARLDWSRSSGHRLAAMALSPGVFLCLTYGQTAFFTSAALGAGFALAEGSPLAAGLLLGALAVKPQVALVVPFALAALGAWRAFVGTGAVAAGLVLLSIVLFGLEPWQLFLGVTLPQQTAILAADDFDTVMMISPFFLARGAGLAVGSAYVLQAIVSLVVLGLLVAGLRREPDSNLRFLMIAAAVLLASPYMQAYELPVLVLAVARVLGCRQTCARLGPGLLKALAASVTVATMVTLAMLTRTGLNATALVPAALLALLALRGSNDRRAPLRA